MCIHADSFLSRDIPSFDGQRATYICNHRPVQFINLAYTCSVPAWSIVILYSLHLLLYLYRLSIVSCFLLCFLFFPLSSFFSALIIYSTIGQNTFISIHTHMGSEYRNIYLIIFSSILYIDFLFKVILLLGESFIIIIKMLS